MADKQIKVKQCIQTLMKTAVTVVFTLDECGEELSGRLEETAESLQKTFRLDEKIMEEYRSTVTAAKEIQKLSSELCYAEAEQARDVIYEMCDCLDNPKEIMKYVRTACEMLDVWNPEKITG